MHNNTSRAAPGPWACLAIGLALAALALWPAPREALDWRPDLAMTQPWRLWTAALVHLSPFHLQANLLGCAVVATFGVVAGLPRHATWAWLAAWPLTHAALGLQPELASYSGLSGLLHAGVAVATVQLIWEGTRRERLIGLAVLAGLSVKLILEGAWPGLPRAAAGWDMPIAPLAHLTGAAAGLLCGAGARWLVVQRREIAT